MSDTEGTTAPVQAVTEAAAAPRRAIDKVKAHYSAKDRQRIKVPEWGLVIYARPMTLDDSARAMAIRGDDPKKWYPAVLVTMAEDEDGRKLFSFTEVDALTTSADSRVVIDVAMKITGDKVTPEDHRGN